MKVRLPIQSVPSRDCSDVRVMLINPPQSYPRDLEDEYQSYFPMGIASLAAAIEPTRAQLSVVDCLASDEMRYEGDLVWFGSSFDELVKKIQSFQPHIVGISNAFSMFIADALRVADVVKAVDPKIKVVLGGIEASVAPNNRRLLTDNQTLDVLVKSEGEVTVCDLLSKFSVRDGEFHGLSDVLGIMFRGPSGDVVETAKRPWIRELDSLPMPAYHLLDMDRMFSNPFYARWRGREEGRRCLPIHTSRGCPYSCNFCSVHSQVGKANRRHTTAAVVAHMQFLKKTYGVSHFHFEDDNLTINPRHTRELFEAVRELGVTFDTPNGIRADTVTPDVAELFREAGATSITIAVESGVQRVLDHVVHKALDLKDVVKAADALDREDILCSAFFIVGLPGETQDDVRSTLRFAKQLASDHGTVNLLFVANPLPGTPLHHQCETNGYLVNELNKDTILRAIRINQAPLIATNEFNKRDLFNWAREELAVSDIVSSGSTMPVFTANTSAGRSRLARFCKQPENGVSPFPWAAGYQG
jgi:anaerobic magnesium-protoporphyrin IX monomethyl ester cyclase